PRILYAVAPQAEAGAALRPFGHLQLGAAAQGGHFDLVSEGSLGEADRDFTGDIVAVASEDLVRPNGDEDVEIARRAAPLPGLPFPCQPHPEPVVDAGGNLNLYLPPPVDGARAAALLTRRLDDLSFPAAAAARLDVHEAAEGGLPRLAEFARSAALGTRADRRPRLRLVPPAVGAHLRPRDFDLRLDAEGGFFEADLHVVAEVRALPGACRAPPFAAEEHVEDIFETAESAG